MLSNKKPRLDTDTSHQILAPQVPQVPQILAPQIPQVPQIPQIPQVPLTYTVDPTNGIFSATHPSGPKSALNKLKNRYFPTNEYYSLFDLQNSYKQLLDKMGEITLGTQYYNTSNIQKETHNYKTSLELLFLKVVKKLSSIDRQINPFEYNEVNIMKINLGVLWNYTNGKLSTPSTAISYTLSNRGGKRNKSKKYKKSIMYKKNNKSRKH